MLMQLHANRCLEIELIFSCTLPYEPFSFNESSLYPFTVMLCNHEYIFSELCESHILRKTWTLNKNILEHGI